MVKVETEQVKKALKDYAVEDCPAFVIRIPYSKVEDLAQA